jgi:beta-phosphoglucomutase-like phosphatase (HAD superfamily)
MKFPQPVEAVLFDMDGLLVEPTKEIHGLCFAVVETLHEVRAGLLKWHGIPRSNE